jgi:hypothetical protein
MTQAIVNDPEMSDEVRLIASLEDGAYDSPVLSLRLTVPRISHLLRLISLAQLAAQLDDGFQYAEYTVPHRLSDRVYLSYYLSGELRNDTPLADREAIYEAVELGWGVVPFAYRVCEAFHAPVEPRMHVDVESVAFLIESDSEDMDQETRRTQPLTEAVLRKLREKLLGGSSV